MEPQAARGPQPERTRLFVHNIIRIVKVLSANYPVGGDKVGYTVMSHSLEDRDAVHAAAAAADVSSSGGTRRIGGRVGVWMGMLCYPWHGMAGLGGRRRGGITGGAAVMWVGAGVWEALLRQAKAMALYTSFRALSPAPPPILTIHASLTPSYTYGSLLTSLHCTDTSFTVFTPQR